MRQRLLKFIFVSIMISMMPKPVFSAATLFGDHKFKFNGYFRSGIGLNGKGGQQAHFFSSRLGRLGNEDFTFGEAGLTDEFRKSAEDTVPLLAATIMFSFQTPQQKSFDYAIPAWSQVYVVGRFWESGARAWVGNRYYLREKVDIMDYYYYDLSSPGAGIQDIPLGGRDAKAAFAVLLRGVTGEVVRSTSSIGTPVATLFDLRLYGLRSPFNGNFELGLTSAVSSGGSLTADNSVTESFEGIRAYGVTLKYGLAIQDSAIGTTLQFCNGVPDIFRASTITDTSIVRPQGSQNEQAWRFRLIQDASIFFSEHWHLDAALVYEASLSHLSAMNRLSETNLVLRPYRFLTPDLGLLMELGFSSLTTTGAPRKNIGKITFAVQTSLARDVNFHPLLRAFVTYAHWSDSFKGVGSGTVDASGAYASSTQGSSIGIQGEAAW